MIETRTPKDIRTFKANVLGPFTLRQTVCIAIATGVDIALYFTLKRPFGIDMYFFTFLLFMIDVGIFMFTFEPKGMKMEEYLKKVVWKNFSEPQKKRNLCIKYLIVPIKKKDDEEVSKKMIKKNPSFKGYK